MFRGTPHKKALWRVWHYAYLDSRVLFCSARQELGRDDDTQRLCDETGLSAQTLLPQRALVQHDIQRLCDEVGLAPSEELRVVPTDPRRPAARGNITLVSREDRMLLAKIWRHCSDVEMYKSALDRQLCGKQGGQVDDRQDLEVHQL